MATKLTYLNLTLKTGTDEQLTEMFTQANLEILNELNRLHELQKDGGNHSQTPLEEPVPPPTQLIPTVTIG